MTSPAKIIDPNERGISFTIGGRSRTIRGRFRPPSKGSVVIASAFATQAVQAVQEAGGIPAGLTAGLTHGLTAAGVLAADIVHFGE